MSSSRASLSLLELRISSKDLNILLILDLNITKLLFLDFVTKGNLVSTLPRWGEYFEVSMNIWIDALEGNEGGWSELLRFTVTEKDCCAPGDRVLAIFVNSGGFLHVTGHVGTNGNYNTNVNIKLKTWMRVEIKQYPENGEVKNI